MASRARSTPPSGATGDQAAQQALADTAAVQSTLKLAGDWTGPVDGHWTPELTDALKTFQTDLGVEPTGAVDAATLAALEQAITRRPNPTHHDLGLQSNHDRTHMTVIEHREAVRQVVFLVVPASIAAAFLDRSRCWPDSPDPA